MEHIRLRVLILETQTLFGKALCALLAFDADLEILGDVRGIAELQPYDPAPDILIFDLDNYSEPIRDLVDDVRSALSSARLCAISEHLSPNDVERCLESGISGLILKDVLPAEFIRALKMIAQGEAYVDPRVAGSLLRRKAVSPIAAVTLTPRETDIIRLVALGLSNKEIGVRLTLSGKTVKSHLGRIFAKLKISGRTRAAIQALKSGLV
jgi:DNA-binding NarL/FixJ family response regulator